jgi:hypothetical protein
MARTTQPPPTKAARRSDFSVSTTSDAGDPSDEEEDVGDTRYEIAKRIPYPPFRGYVGHQTFDSHKTEHDVPTTLANLFQMFTYFTPFQLMVDVEMVKGLTMNDPSEYFAGTVLHPLNDITEIMGYLANRQFIGRSPNPPGTCDIWNTQTVRNHVNQVVIEADSIIYHSLSTAASGKKERKAFWELARHDELHWAIGRFTVHDSSVGLKESDRRSNKFFSVWTMRTEPSVHYISGGEAGSRLLVTANVERLFLLRRGRNHLLTLLSYPYDRNTQTLEFVDDEPFLFFPKEYRLKPQDFVNRFPPEQVRGTTYGPPLNDGIIPPHHNFTFELLNTGDESDNSKIVRVDTYDDRL